MEATGIIYLTVVFFFLVAQSSGQTFWRMYDGTIPDDAIVADQDNHGNLYIAQAYYYLEDQGGIGVISGEFRSGSSTLYVGAANQVLSSSILLRILCGPNQSLTWLTTTGQTAIDDLQGLRPVVGGFEQYFPNDYEYIGKVTNSNGTFVGKVTPQQPQGTGILLFVSVQKNNEVTSTGTFDILVYNENYVAEK